MITLYLLLCIITFMGHVVTSIQYNESPYFYTAMVIAGVILL